MAYAELHELQARLGDWVLNDEESRMAIEALEEASDLAIHYGKAWDEASCPRLVKRLVLRASKRHLVNDEGYTTSRAGDETLGWSDLGDKAGAIFFTKDEQAMLSAAAGKRAPSFGSIGTYAWGSGKADSHRAGYVPVASGGADFPLFAGEDEW